MDAYDMPVAFVAAIIALGVWYWGMRLHGEELRTGKDPRGFYTFTLVLVGVGGGIYYLGGSSEFFGDLAATLTGLCLGAGSAYYGLRLVRQILLARHQKRPRPQED